MLLGVDEHIGLIARISVNIKEADRFPYTKKQLVLAVLLVADL